MTSQILRDARKYEMEMERKIAGEHRPVFHLSSRVGWMNDPNGFSFYKGGIPYVLSVSPLLARSGGPCALGACCEQGLAALGAFAGSPGAGYGV